VSDLSSGTVAQKEAVRNMPDLVWDSLSYFGILIALYTTTVAIYFILGYSLTWLNGRNPERKIQRNRGSGKRRAAEIRQSLASMFIACLPVTLGLYFQFEGWAMVPWTLRWWTALPLFILCMFLYDTWFYFMHRMLHTKMFYRFHALHHKSVAPSIWSTYSEDLLDTALLQGFSTVIVFVVPFPPAILIAQRLFEHFNGLFGHAGFEYFASSAARYPSPMLCTTFHDQHHSGFRYNYGNYFSFWDRMLGTISPEYDRHIERFEAEVPRLRITPVLASQEAEKKTV
jgi:sterol desaturase/sphingolipid hydroxylase (fatty acid hydroxylase superfamily)